MDIGWLQRRFRIVITHREGCGPTGHVIALEPDPFNYELLLAERSTPSTRVP